MKLADLACVELSIGIKCAGCGQLIPVNGACTVARCPACEATVKLEGALRWQELLTVRNPPVDLFKAAVTQKDGAVEVGERDGVVLRSLRAWPKCACGRRFEATKLAGTIAAGGIGIGCPACNVESVVARPPAYFRAAIPVVVALVGAEVALEDQSKNRPTKPKPPATQSLPWWALFDRSRA